MSSRRLQDMFSRRLQDQQMFAGDRLIQYMETIFHEVYRKTLRRISIRQNDRRFRREIYLSMRINVCL